MISNTISDMISYTNMHLPHCLCPAAADPPPAQHADETDDDREPDRMVFDEERGYALSQTLAWSMMEEDSEILLLL
jgi:hypothetical protein